MTRVERAVLRLQRMEILQAEVYSRLATLEKDPSNRERLQIIANDEREHYKFWTKQTKTESRASKLTITWYLLIAKLFGLSFCLNLLEQKEHKIAGMYDEILDVYPEASKIREDEERHEELLLANIKEDYLNYTGSFVLGLNDALIEMTGVLAGLTFVFQEQKTTAIAGLVTGVAASLSMASSEYISKGAEENEQSRLKAAGYTGMAYLVTVLLLISPYLLITPEILEILPTSINAHVFCLLITLIISFFIIFSFNYYTSVALRRPLWKNFFEMLLICLVVTTITFFLSLGIRNL